MIIREVAVNEIPQQPVWNQPYQYPGAPPARLSLGGLVTALTVLLAIVAVVELVGAVALLASAAMFEDAAAGRFVDEAAAQSVDAVLTATYVLYILLFIAIAVVFIIWQYRHGRNAQALGGRPALGPGWAIGGWFIPLANLLLPSLQIYQSTRASTERGGAARGGALIVAWAIPYYLSNILALIESSVYPDELVTQEELEMAAASDVVGSLANLVSVAAAVMCVVMVRTLTKRQDAAFGARHAGGMPAAPAGGGGWGHRPWYGSPANDQPTYWAPSPSHQPYAAPEQPHAAPPQDPRRGPGDPWQSPPR